MKYKDQNLKIAIDSESINIYRENGENEEPTHVVYWHETEWLEDAETVVPAIVRAMELYYTDQYELLSVLGVHDLIIK